MRRYQVNHSYRSFSDGKLHGPFEAGATVELDDAVAAWVNRDSPGCLTALDDIAAVAEQSTVDADGEPEPAKDRAHKGGRRRG